LSALSATSTISQSEECLAADVGVELVLMTMRKGLYLSLDPIGADIWKRLSPPIAVAELRDLLAQEYEASPDTIEADLIEMLTELAEAGVIEVSP
jgi:hypothetical protein